VAPLRVLIVEDEPIVGMMLEEALQDLGCEVVAIAYHFDTAMSYAENADLDVAMLDINLRGERSYPVADVLTERGIPLLFVTGYGSHVLPGYRYAPTLEKPVDLDVLRKVLTEIKANAVGRP
jgi:DNA-binding response OmpR family regulator